MPSHEPAAQPAMPDPDWPWRKVLLAMLAVLPDEVLREAGLQRERGDISRARVMLRDERDAAISRAEQAERERDEARACMLANTEELHKADAAIGAARLELADLRGRLAKYEALFWAVEAWRQKRDEATIDALWLAHQNVATMPPLAPSAPPAPGPVATPLAAQMLRGWANNVAARFGRPLYLVGSVLDAAEPWDARDVDVVCILPDTEFESRYGKWERIVQAGPAEPGAGAKRWFLECGKVGREVSTTHRLNIDFKVQPASEAANHPGKRLRLDDAQPCWRCSGHGRTASLTDGPAEECHECGGSGKDKTRAPTAPVAAATPPESPDSSARGEGGQGDISPLPWVAHGSIIDDARGDITARAELASDAAFIVARCNAPAYTFGVDHGTDMGSAEVTVPGRGMPRVGRHQQRNIYIGDDYVGVAFREQDARLIVTALTAYAAPPATDDARAALAKEVLSLMPKCRCGKVARHIGRANHDGFCDAHARGLYCYDAHWVAALDIIERAAKGEP